jgi:hypothetical protein
MDKDLGQIDVIIENSKFSKPPKSELPNILKISDFCGIRKPSIVVSTPKPAPQKPLTRTASFHSLLEVTDSIIDTEYRKRYFSATPPASNYPAGQMSPFGVPWHIPKPPK